jgi:hypothetical protein
VIRRLAVLATALVATASLTSCATFDRSGDAAVVNGHTYTYDGVPLPNTYMYWEAPYGTTWEWGETYTDLDGAYAFSGLPAASGAGYLYAEYPSSPWFAMWRAGASWTGPSASTRTWSTAAT